MTCLWRSDPRRRDSRRGGVIESDKKPLPEDGVEMRMRTKSVGREAQASSGARLVSGRAHWELVKIETQRQR